MKRCPLCSGYWERVAMAAAFKVGAAMEADTYSLMDRYHLTLQRGVTEEPTFDGLDLTVRAIGPGPAGQPSDWQPTTVAAVADWVAKHAATYQASAVASQPTPSLAQADGQASDERE